MTVKSKWQSRLPGWTRWRRKLDRLQLPCRSRRARISQAPISLRASRLSTCKQPQLQPHAAAVMGEAAIAGCAAVAHDQNRMLTHGAADSLLPTKCSTLSLQNSTLNTGLAFPWQWLAYVSKSFGCFPKSQAYMLIHSTSNFTKLGHLSRRYRRGHRSGSATSDYSYFEFPPYYVDVAHRTKRGLQNSNNARDERRSSTLSSSLRRRLAALALTPDPLD